MHVCVVGPGLFLADSMYRTDLRAVTVVPQPTYSHDHIHVDETPVITLSKFCASLHMNFSLILSHASSHAGFLVLRFCTLVSIFPST